MWYAWYKIKRTVTGKNKVGEVAKKVTARVQLILSIVRLLSIIFKIKHSNIMPTQNLTIKTVVSYVLSVLRQIFWPYDVYKRDEDGNIVYIKDHGKDLPIPNKLASIIAKVASLIIAIIGTAELFGIPIAEWLYLLFDVSGIAKILGF